MVVFSLHASLFWYRCLAVLVVALAAHAATGRAAGEPPAASDRADMAATADLPANLRIVLRQTRPLAVPRGTRLPLYVLPITNSLRGLSDARAEQVLQGLDARGIAVTVDWNPSQRNESLAEGLRIGALQQKHGLGVNVNATACLSSFFNGDERTAHVDEQGRPFFDDSFDPGVKIGCPFAVGFREPVIKEQVEFFLRSYARAGVEIAFIFADWEIDGPIEWNGAWAAAKHCRRCRQHIQPIDDFRTFQKELRLIRCAMQRTAFGANVARYFPRARVGNYAVYPHDGYRYWYDYFEKPVAGAPYKADQRARYREWFPEFERTGYTCAMPVVYTWYSLFGWYDFPNPDYRWFYNMLLVASNSGRHRRPGVPNISFVHWTTTAPPTRPDPAVRQFSAEKYQELLRHMLLRGHDTFFLWCQDPELAEEIRLVHEVYAESLRYQDYLTRGQPVTFDVPQRTGPVVSAVRLDDKVLVGRTDFDDRTPDVWLRVGDRPLRVPPLPGQWQVFDLKSASDNKSRP